MLLLSTLLVLLATPGISQDRFGGLALYTVRQDMAKDPKATLKAVAEAGYTHIEVADYKDGKFYGMTPGEFRTYVDKLGLIPVSAHMGMVTLDNADQLIADVKAAGITYFVIPVPPMGHFKFDPATRTMNMTEELVVVTDILSTLGRKCSDAGIKLLYHNHDFEFKPNSKGVVPIEFFLANADAAHVNFQMDIFWVTKAGADPLAYFEKYPGRFKSWHVKDMDAEGKFAPVGTGTIDFGKILAKKEQSGMQFYLVEQDMTFDKAPLDVIKISHEGLKKFGFN